LDKINGDFVYKEMLMKGIYISVPDSEFNFYMAVLERFKTVTVLKTDEITHTDIGQNLHPWQIEELEEILKEEAENPQKALDGYQVLKELRKELDV
jgi:hypothetical protein